MTNIDFNKVMEQSGIDPKKWEELKMKVTLHSYDGKHYTFNKQVLEAYVFLVYLISLDAFIDQYTSDDAEEIARALNMEAWYSV